MLRQNLHQRGERGKRRAAEESRDVKWNITEMRQRHRGGTG